MKAPVFTRVVVLAIVTFLIGARAQAQVAPPPTQDDQSRPRIRAAGFSANPTFAMTNVGTDSNVFNSAENPQRDFTMTVTPALDLWARAGKARAAVRGRSDLVYFQKFASERSVDGGFAARVDVPLIHLQPWVEVAGYSGRQRVGYEIDVRSRRTERAGRMGLDYVIGPKTTISLSVRHATTKWDGDAVQLGDSLSQSLDRKQNGGALTYRQRLTALTTLVGDVSGFADRFDAAHERDADNVQGTFGVDLNARALISGSARIGVRRFTPKDAGFAPFSGVIDAVDVGYTLRGSTRFAVQSTRDVAFSYERAYPYYVDTGVGLTITQRVTSKWDVQATGQRHRLSYESLFSSAATVPDRIDSVDQLGGGGGYRLNPDLRLGVSLDRYRRISPVQHHDYTGFKMGASLTYAR